ncbi:MAG: HAD-IIB family hydrolase [Saprospiraceae bacterium]|nr:HAD-IIB family hydrolase [Saprospiraceae bacterium]
MQHPPFVLFTDLDGTLLDHHTYKANCAVSAIDALNKAKVPIIFCSSKTFDEQRFYQKKFGIHGPLIVENGSAIYIPEYFLPGYFKRLPKTVGGFFYHNFAHVDIIAVRSILSEISIQYHLPVAGYANAALETLSEVTGLKTMALKRARNRHFTETLTVPSLLDIESAQQLAKFLKKYDLTLVKGGRFWSVQSKFAGKGNALLWLNKVMEDFYQCKIPFYAIGDSANDLSMLQVADRAFLVKKNNGTWETTYNKGIERINKIGTDGFKTAVELMLK